MEIQEIRDSDVVVAPAILTVAIAVNGSKQSKCAVKWALDKFIPEQRILFRLLHVQPKVKVIPTPMGNYIPISQVREDVAKAYKKEKEWESHSLLLPYKKMCAQKKVEAEAVILESDDIAEAINEEIIKYKIGKLVLGASSKNIFTRKISGNKMSSKISENMPDFCTVFIISKGKLLSVKSATSALDDEIPKTPLAELIAIPNIDSSNFGSFASTSNSEWTNNTDAPSLRRYPSLSSQRNQALSNINNNKLISNNNARFENLISNNKSLNSETNNSLNYSYEEASSSNSLCNSSQVDLNLDLERVRVKIRQQLFKAVDSSNELQELGIKHIEEETKSQENSSKNSPKIEKKEERENEPERIEIRAERESKKVCVYNRYTWQEIESATSAFSDALVIGKGANGTVYKGKFYDTIAAVKVLHSLEASSTKQLKQEVEILTKMRHPNLLVLLGSYPEKGILIYEYMQNGSLQDLLQCRQTTGSLQSQSSSSTDHLQCRQTTGDLQWQDRFRILYEVASALVFLHTTKPDPIIHRDLKPANILLDKNLVSKIGDVGLSTLIPKIHDNYSTNNNINTRIKDTDLVGTFCYIDPEYQRTGTVSIKSDIYALGIIILQMLTGQPPMGVTNLVEKALERDTLMEVLDKRAGKWPLKEAKELGLIGLSCAELRRRDRPNMREQVLPVLERIKEFGEREKEKEEGLGLPGHFICPILQEVMEDPYVASDGYTYEKKAIELWLSMNEKSPMTNLKLTNKNLIPNHSLRSGISDWKSRNIGI